MSDDHDESGRPRERGALTVERTPTGYWSVKRAGVEVAFAMTEAAAEHERETLSRLGLCTARRAGERATAQP